MCREHGSRPGLTGNIAGAAVSKPSRYYPYDVGISRIAYSCIMNPGLNLGYDDRYLTHR